jgi:hypothetical protein
MSQDNTTKCHRCGGAGRLRIDEPESNGGQISAVCDRCGGSGRTSQTTRKPIYCPRRRQHDAVCETPDGCAGGADCRLGPDLNTRMNDRPATSPTTSLAADRNGAHGW